MSVYGISWIKLNNAGNEVDEVLIHQAISKDTAGNLTWNRGEAMAYHEVANLIVGGDTVFVLVKGYRHTDEVRVKPGQHKYLESFGKNGAATNSLMGLPK